MSFRTGGIVTAAARHLHNTGKAGGICAGIAIKEVFTKTFTEMTTEQALEKLIADKNRVLTLESELQAGASCQRAQQISAELKQVEARMTEYEQHLPGNAGCYN